MSRYAAKVDANQTAIIKALREIGATVFSLAGVHNGCPDLLVGIGMQTYLVEVKDGNKPPSARQLTPDQAKFVSTWEGSPVVILKDVDIARAWGTRMKGGVGGT